MTVHDAIVRTQGSSPGFLNRLSARYAETLLEPGETVLAAVVANITAGREHFPGVVVLSDRRALAACGLPGIRRCVSCAWGASQTWTEKAGAIHYQASFSDAAGAFTMTVDPDTGERFSRALAVGRGEEAAFDAAGGSGESFLFNPTLARSRRRARLRKEQQRQEQQRREGEDAGKAGREEGRKVQDPKAIAARLTQELAEDPAAGEARQGEENGEA